MAIPGIFPAVEYDGSMLVDGGVLCNFPLEYAKRDYPEQEVIGIYLRQFRKDQPVNSLMDTLMLSYMVSMQAHLLKDLDLNIGQVVSCVVLFYNLCFGE